MGVLRANFRAVFSFPVALASLLAIWVYLLANGSIGDPDIGWHLLNARYLFGHHRLPWSDLYSSTALGRPWINHEWLAEIPYYLGWRAWGLRGINGVALLLVEVILLGTFYWSYKSSGNLKASWLVSCFCVLLGAVSFGPRTLLFGYVYLLLLLLVLGRYRTKGRGPLGVIPLLFVLWINTHGSWVMGLGIFGILIGAGAVKKDWTAVEITRWSPQQLRALLVTFGASVAALFANPYGYRLVLYPFDLAFRQPLMVSHTEEWASVNFHTPRGKTVIALFVMVLLGSLLSRYRWKLEELALTSVALYLGLMHVRFLFLAAILLAPLLAKFLEFVPPYRPEIDRPLFNAAIVALVLVVGVTKLPSEEHLENELAKTLPTQALTFVRSHGLVANGFNYYGWGGYLEWQAPDIKTFIDSRNDIFERSGILQDYLDVTGIRDPLKVLDKHHVEWVLFPPKDPFAYFLSHTETWKVVYNDNVAEVFVRTTPAPAASPNLAVAEARHSP